MVMELLINVVVFTITVLPILMAVRAKEYHKKLKVRSKHYKDTMLIRVYASLIVTLLGIIPILLLTTQYNYLIFILIGTITLLIVTSPEFKTWRKYNKIDVEEQSPYLELALGHMFLLLTIAVAYSAKPV